MRNNYCSIKKQILAGAFALSFACSSVFTEVIPMSTAYAAVDESQPGFTIKDGVLTEYSGNNPIVNVPDGVIAIDQGAFNKKKASVEKVILPGSVKKIERYAFSDCSALTTVTFSYRLTEIGDGAFSGCTNLQSIDLSKTKVEILKKNTFKGCKKLTDVILPDSVEVISADCFAGDEHLGQINLPEGLLSIGGNAFDGCISLSSIDLPDSLVNIDSMAFGGCSSLQSIKIPAGITVIPSYLCKDDCYLENVYLPDTVKIINRDAFQTDGAIGQSNINGNLSKIYLPDSLEYIDERNLDRFSGLKTFSGASEGVANDFFEMAKARADQRGGQTARTQENWPIAYEEVVKDADICFDACGGNIEYESKKGIVGQMYGYLPTPSLMGYSFAGWYADKGLNKQVKTTTLIKSAKSTLYAKWIKEESVVEGYTGKTSDFTIENGTLKKYNGSELTVIVPDTVKTIGICAFQDNISVKRIVLPDSVDKIERMAFYGCENLLEVNIPKGVTSISDNTFAKCYSLTSLVIPEGVTNIENDAFNEAKALKDISLPKSLRSIGIMAFSGCSSLMEIELPEGLLELGDLCFDGCISLLELRIPKSVTAIPSKLCYNCSALMNLYSSDSITSIGKEIILGNRAMKKIYISKNATQIDDNAFANTNLSSLTIVGVKDTEAYYYYQGLKNSNSLGSDFKLSFEEVKTSATISFNTGIDGLSVESMNSYTGMSYGALPKIKADGKIFVGWSTDGTEGNIVGSTDVISAQNVNLTAVWKDKITPAENEPVVYGGGEDTPENNIVEISDAAGLDAIRNDLSGHYKLMNDIDLTDEVKDGGSLNVGDFGFLPIGARKESDDVNASWTADAFTGVFDGNGHKIKGLSIKGEAPYKDVGLFARAEGATIKNLTFVDADIEIGTATVRSGILAGYVAEDPDTGKKSEISNVTAKGKVYMTAGTEIVAQNVAVAGIIGYLGNASITKSTNYAEVFYYTNEKERPNASCSRFLAGVAGYLDNGGTVSKCSNQGTISAYRYFDGIFDYGEDGDVVEKALLGTSDYLVAGGIVGVAAKSGKISQCYNTGEVRSLIDNVHTLFSLNVTSTYNAISGGIVGTLYKNTSVINCYNKGAIKSAAHTKTSLVAGDMGDGLIGAILAMLDGITASAPVNAMARAYSAGIVGFSTNIASGPVKYCYNTGSLDGDISDSDLRVYGIANGNVPISYCHYAAMTATVSDKQYTLTGSPQADSLSTAQSVDVEDLTRQESYRGFDFNSVWFMVDGNDDGTTPMLYSNLKGSVSDVEILGEPTKKSYKYGEALDLTGVSVKYRLSSMADEALVELSGSGSTDYDPYKTGTQIITLEYFGETKSFEVTVGDMSHILSVESGVIRGENDKVYSNRYFTLGDSFDIEADEAKSDYCFSRWVVLSGSAEFGDPLSMKTTVTPGAKDTVIGAEYEIGQLITVKNGRIIEVNGRALDDGVTKGYFARGAKLKIKADAPAEGMQFDRWKINISYDPVLTDEFEYTVAKVSPTFEAKYKTATASGDGSMGEGGDNNPSVPGGTTDTQTDPTTTNPQASTTDTQTPVTPVDTTTATTPVEDKTVVTDEKAKVVVPSVAKVKGFKVTAGKKKLTIKWTKLKNISGYELQYSTNKNFKKSRTVKIKSGVKKCIISKLKAKKKYYVRIRGYKTYKTAAGKSKKAYGKWVSLSKKTK